MKAMKRARKSTKKPSGPVDVPDLPIDQIHPEALDQMRRLAADGCTWQVYRNCDLGHPELGHMLFLKTGPACTFTTPPPRHPDTNTVIGWRYLHVGHVDLHEGKVIENVLPEGQKSR